MTSTPEWLLAHGFHRDSDDPDTWRRNKDLRVPQNTEGPGLSFQEAAREALRDDIPGGVDRGDPARYWPDAVEDDARCAVCNALLGIGCERDDCPRTQWLTRAAVPPQAPPMYVAVRCPEAWWYSYGDDLMPEYKAKIRASVDEALTALGFVQVEPAVPPQAANAEALAESVRETIGAPTQHHLRCDSRRGAECDCYMRRYTPGLEALDALLAQVAEAKRELDWAREKWTHRNASVGQTWREVCERAERAETEAERLRAAVEDFVQHTTVPEYLRRTRSFNALVRALRGGDTG